MAAIVGQRATPETGHNVEALPAIRNRYRFLYLAHPHRWFWSAEDATAGNDGWLPELGRLNISPGVGGTKDSKRGDIIDLAVLGAQNDGWLVIRDDDHRLGKYRNYLQKFPTVGKSSVWASIFDSVRMVGNKAVWKFDDKAYREFLRHLVAAGIVQPCDEAVRESKADDLRSKIERMQGRLAAGAHNPALEVSIRGYEVRLAGMQGAVPPSAVVAAAKAPRAQKPAPAPASATP